jgi:hypothetical protein
LNKLNKIFRGKWWFYFILLAALVVVLANIGKERVNGKYGEKYGFSVEIIEGIKGGRIYVSDFNDGRSTVGRILSIEKSVDGKIINVLGVMRYSGGTGSAFGSSVTQAQWFESPFQIDVDLESGVLFYSGLLENKYHYTRSGLKRGLAGVK